MELKDLTSKLKEIPFEEWKRERTPSRTIKYRTKIKDFGIRINLLYPQHPLDDTKISLDIFSPKNELIAERLYNPNIAKIVMDLEKINDNLKMNERIKIQKDNYRKLSKLFDYLKIA